VLLRSKPGRSSQYGRHMSGALILALVLLAFPIVVGLSTAALAAVLGFFLNKDAETRHQGSELLQLND
jgi:multisubunit Na+/H+ antiporter MnhC subunit